MLQLEELLVSAAINSHMTVIIHHELVFCHNMTSINCVSPLLSSVIVISTASSSVL